MVLIENKMESNKKTAAFKINRNTLKEAEFAVIFLLLGPLCCLCLAATR